MICCSRYKKKSFMYFMHWKTLFGKNSKSKEKSKELWNCINLTTSNSTSNGKNKTYTHLRVLKTTNIFNKK